VSDRRILLDTGPLVALLTSVDLHHQLCVKTFAALSPPLLTCWPVLAEAAWILRNQHRPFERIADLHADGMFEILTLEGTCLRSIAAIMTRYESARLQMADATLVHLADREHIRTVFTLDRRDFTILRLKGNRSFRLIPEVQ